MKNNPKERYGPSPEKLSQIKSNVSNDAKYISLICSLEHLLK